MKPIAMHSPHQARIRLWMQQPVLPVVVAESVDEGLWIAEAMLEASMNQIEITLRTDAALPTIAALTKRLPDMRVSAGTIRSAEDFRQARDAGASLFISPGFTPTLAEAARSLGLLWIPGVANASDVMLAHEAGIDVVKFFPAMAAGGPPALSALVAALHGIQFIPTGGIKVDRLSDWKQITEVIGVGGSWLTAGLKPNPADRATLVQRTRFSLEAWAQA